MPPQLAGTGFQVLFHSPPGVHFTCPSQYSALSVTGGYLGLRGGPRTFRQGFTCPGVLWVPPVVRCFALTGLSPSPAGFPKAFLLPTAPHPAAPYPAALRAAVWPPPLPLAATQGIDFSFFSSGYLDVSVRRVPLHTLCVHVWIHGFCPCGLPHSDTRGSPGICPSPRLFAACRVFHRPPVPGHPPCALPV